MAESNAIGRRSDELQNGRGWQMLNAIFRLERYILNKLCRLERGGNMHESTALRESVRGAYSAAACDPQTKHPFPVGARFAESLGYSPELLSCLPSEASEVFAGVSNVSLAAPLQAGMRVVDLGCGAGLDSLIAAGRVGSVGRVIGIDFSAEMLSRARIAARKSGASNAYFIQSAAESLPLADASVDLAMVNGIFNLNPFRAQIFMELARVVRSGGTVAGAELILREALPNELKTGDANWFS
jgi:SAM-dependent methyltransferase